MAMVFDATGDFSAIVDAAEPLTLLRRGSSVEVAIAGAWRFADRRSEAEPTGGYVISADVTFQFEWPASTTLPQLGDQLRDAAEECYTVLVVERLQGGTRIRCGARSLRIASGLDSLIDVEQAVWADLGSGLEITGWATVRSAVHARIQPDETTIDETADPITSTAIYRVTLDDDSPLDHNHRIVAGDGAVYRMLSYTAAERMDVLPVAVVRREN